MSLARRSFLRALIGIPVAAKAMERIIAGGAQPKVEPVRPTPQPAWEQGNRWDAKRYGVSGHFSTLQLSGVSCAVSGTYTWPGGISG